MDTTGSAERISLSNEEIIILTEDFAKDYMKKYDDSHSFDHAMRVKNMATTLAISENLNEKQIFIIQHNILKTFSRVYPRIYKGEEGVQKL